MKTSEFIEAAAIFGAIIFIFRKKAEQNPQKQFDIRFFELSDYPKLLVENSTSDSIDISVFNEDITKSVNLKWGQEEMALMAGKRTSLILLPSQKLTGQTFYGLATISVLIQ